MLLPGALAQSLLLHPPHLVFVLVQPLPAQAEPGRLGRQPVVAGPDAVQIAVDAHQIGLEPGAVVDRGVAHLPAAAVASLHPDLGDPVGELALEPAVGLLRPERGPGDRDPALPRPRGRPVLAPPWPRRPVLAARPVAPQTRRPGLGPDMNLRLAVQQDRPGLVAPPQGLVPLRFKSAVIHAGPVSAHLEKGVLPGGEVGPPHHHQFLGVPFPRLDRTEPLGRDLAQAQQHMRMKIAALIVLARDRVMDGEVGGHAARHELVPHEPPHQLQPFLVAQLVRQRHRDLAGDLRVAPVLHGLGLVPQPVAVRHPLRRALGQHDLAVFHALAATEIVGHPVRLVAQSLAGAIGRRRHRRMAMAALEHLHGKMERGHASLRLPHTILRVCASCPKAAP